MDNLVAKNCLINIFEFIVLSLTFISISLKEIIKKSRFFVLQIGPGLIWYPFHVDTFVARVGKHFNKV